MARLVAAARAAGIPHVASADDHELTDAEISETPGLRDHLSAALPARARAAPRRSPETRQADPVPLALTEVPGAVARGREFLLLKKSFDVFTNPNAERLLELPRPRRGDRVRRRDRRLRRRGDPRPACSAGGR